MVDLTSSGTQGLYCSEYEHDACGVGFLAHIKGKKTLIVVTHRLSTVQHCDNVFYISNGTPQKIINQKLKKKKNFPFL